jgi:hypothetical protein
MLAFAGNSLLCRAALKSTAIRRRQLHGRSGSAPVRSRCGSSCALRDGASQSAGSWGSAAALFAYAAAFSYAYLSLSAATGALLLFGAVQTTMIAVGLWRGERLAGRQTAGLVCAPGRPRRLLLPGLSAPPWHGALLMAPPASPGASTRCAPRGRRSAAGHRRQLPARLRVRGRTRPRGHCRGPRSIRPGVGYAVASGALASGVGYCDLVHGAARPARDERRRRSSSACRCSPRSGGVRAATVNQSRCASSSRRRDPGRHLAGHRRKASALS